MKIFHDIEQDSDEWLRLRKGKPTASNFIRIITAKTGELSKQAGDLIDELLEECFFPELQAWQGNYWTEWGKQFEDEAREAFAAETGLALRRAGFVLADDGVCGCSPDAFIVDESGNPVAGLEIKCPRPKTHIGYVRSGGLPDDYRQQVHGSMAITGLPWHFWSYARGLAPHHVFVEADAYTLKMGYSLSEFVKQYRAAHRQAIAKLKVNQIAAVAA